MTTATELTATLTVKKVTSAGTVQYRNPDAAPDTLYLRKDDAAALGNPDAIEVTVRAA
jgi:hypothetical protein